MMMLHASFSLPESFLVKGGRSGIITSTHSPYSTAQDEQCANVAFPVLSVEEYCD